MSWENLAKHLMKTEELYDITNDPPKQIIELVECFDKYWEGKKDFVSGMTLGITISQMLEQDIHDE